MTVSAIELLVPAKNVVSGKAAILHGADALYIGAPKYGARAAAGNSLADLADLTDYAHLYGVKIYVALNTLLFDHELDEVEGLIWDLWNIGVDALIVQDMGILKLNLPPIPLHASTQTDNRTIEKVRFLQDVGFKRVVLARELSLDQIKDISNHSTVPLECFVHGALCVSYSGQCYMSQVFSQRSANRGECAQYCRLPYDLVDSKGRTLIRQKHLLSLKDLNRSAELESLIDAGITSFKIEGRLKDVSYVKNVTAWYRTKLDGILKHRDDLKRASAGHVRLGFQPLLNKSFNRGFTDYFLHQRTSDQSNADTPKSLGEPVGWVKDVCRNSFTVAGLSVFNNGDGLSFLSREGRFEGFRVNRVEENRLYPAKMPDIAPGTQLFRTFDQRFEQDLEKRTAERFIPVNIRCWETAFGFALGMEDADCHRAVIAWEQEKVFAAKAQRAVVESQLRKLGNTIYEVDECDICWSSEWFLPMSVWVEKRRVLCEKFERVRKLAFRCEVLQEPASTKTVNFPQRELDYTGNVLNKKAELFYQEHGVERTDPGYESKNASPSSGDVLMYNKFCLKYELGACPVHQSDSKKLSEPLRLVFNQQSVRLEFDCKVCEMRVVLD
jgi:23S rRNA 5-hydroxycytidine C2501 synthase